MKEDLRYLERLMAGKLQPQQHPDDKKLAAFIDGKLDAQEKEAMFAHLSQCERCTKLILSVPPKSRIRLHIPSRLQILNAVMAVAASLIVFVFISFPKKPELGMVDIAAVLNSSPYRSPGITTDRDQQIDADRYISTILSQTDMKTNTHYQEAVKLERKGMYAEAREKYKQALITIRHIDDAKERISQKIVINYRLLALGLKEQKENDASIEAYKQMLYYDISLYVYEYEKHHR